MSSELTKNNLLTVEQVFKGNFFTIPDYQRGYAWQKLQRDELIEDIELLPENKTHYAGTLVLHPSEQCFDMEDKYGNSYDLLNVVDGQQRLTTIVILLDVMGRYFEEHKKADLAKGIKERYIAIPDTNNQLRLKLTLNKDCHNFFWCGILDKEGALSGPKIRSHRNLQNARSEFKNYLSNKDKELGESFNDWLNAFRKKMCQKLVFTVYIVQESVDVGVIFEVMNNRGLGITELEKTKNYLLYLCSKLNLKGKHDLVTQVNDTCTYIFESLMCSGLASSNNEDQLLQTHWIMAYNSDKKYWKGSKTIKNKFHLREYQNNHKRLLKDLTKYIMSLKDATTAYCDIGNPTRSEAFNNFADNPMLKEKIARMSEKLRRLKVVAPFIPLLISIRLRYQDDPESFLEAVELCEKYSFRVYALMEKRSDAGLSRLYSMANSIYNKNSTWENGKKKIVTQSLYYCSDEQFGRKLELDDEINWYNWKGIKYFLYEYEDYLSNGVAVKIPWEKLEDPKAKQNTIEHILPQTPTNKYWRKHFKKKERDRYTHDIGNLCLTFDNSSYGNKSFPDKKGMPGSDKPCYANASLFMEKFLVKDNDWNPESVEKRRKVMIDWAKDRWAFPSKLTQEFLEYDEAEEDSEADIILEEE
jgi:Protein of unknown function DUF262/Protein of unknown function (DUF1524)